MELVLGALAAVMLPYVVVPALARFAARRVAPPPVGIPWDSLSMRRRAVVMTILKILDVQVAMWQPARWIRSPRLADLGATWVLTVATVIAPRRLRASLVASFSDMEGLPRGRARVAFALRALLATVLDRLGGAPTTAGTPATPRDERVVQHAGRRVTVTLDPEGGVRVEYEDTP